MLLSNPKVRAFDFYFGQALVGLLRVIPDVKPETPEMTPYERQVFDAIVARAEYVAERAMASRSKHVDSPVPVSLTDERQEYMRRDK